MLEQARQKALSTIWKAREEDWRAAESFLKYSFWQDYRSGSQINVNTETNVAVVKTLTEEERMRLIAQRQSSKDRVNALQTSPRLSRPSHRDRSRTGTARAGAGTGSNTTRPGLAEAREKRKQKAALMRKRAKASVSGNILSRQSCDQA
jgi:hypothetical protein